MSINEEELKNHKYYKIMTNLNSTECYLIMLWQGNKQIEELMIPYICKMSLEDPSIPVPPNDLIDPNVPKICNSKEEYYEIRNDFDKKFPGVLSSFKKGKA